MVWKSCAISGSTNDLMVIIIKFKHLWRSAINNGSSYNINTMQQCQMQQQIQFQAQIAMQNEMHAKSYLTRSSTTKC